MSKNRTALVFEGLQERKPLRVEDPKEIEKIVLTNAKANSYFVRHELPGVFVDQFEEAGLIFSEFLLSDVRGWCGLDERDDDLILGVLDYIAKKGKLKFFSIFIDRNTHYTDMTFKVETGRAIRSFKGLDAPKFTTVRYYSEEPMTKKEMKEPHTILDVEQQVQQLRRRRDEYFKKQFGWSREAEIEKELRAIDRAAELELRRAVMDAVRAIKKKGK